MNGCVGGRVYDKGEKRLWNFTFRFLFLGKEVEVRVSSGHLREAEAPTEAVAENSMPARKIGTIRNRKTIVWG